MPKQTRHIYTYSIHTVFTMYTMCIKCVQLYNGYLHGLTYPWTSRGQSLKHACWHRVLYVLLQPAFATVEDKAVFWVCMLSGKNTSDMEGPVKQ